jgi:hypothetical protein
MTFTLELGSTEARSGDSLDVCAQAIEQASASNPQNLTFHAMDEFIEASRRRSTACL